MAVWPLAKVVTKAFRFPFSSGFIPPDARTCAAAAPVPWFGRVINAIMSCMGPLDRTAADILAAVAVRTLGAPCFSSFRIPVFLMEYCPLASLTICFRTLRAVAFKAFFKRLGAATWSCSRSSWAIILCSSSSTSMRIRLSVWFTILAPPIQWKKSRPPLYSQRSCIAGGPVSGLPRWPGAARSRTGPHRSSGGIYKGRSAVRPIFPCPAPAVRFHPPAPPFFCR